ncbi:tyrosine-type recombinase/integrase [Chromobacterium haemolyticum]|nr:tyrosine-type recombinase/integrase [Chromobacterium haemolyticum]
MLIGFASWCREQEEFRDLLPDGVFSSKGVREVIPKAQTKDDCLQREQLAVWFAAVRQESPVMSAYLQALLLTGARREELAGLRWGDVDFKWMSMTIKDKVEGERTIPLTPYVASLLRVLPRKNEWVFSSPSAVGGRIVEPRIAHNRALGVAGLPPLTFTWVAAIIRNVG